MSPAPPLNTWYHLAGVVAGNNNYLYVSNVNGKLIAHGEATDAPPTVGFYNETGATIGWHPCLPLAHDGNIGIIRIYQALLLRQRSATTSWLMSAEADPLCLCVGDAHAAR
jgi:hypothetical protein